MFEDLEAMLGAPGMPPKVKGKPGSGIRVTRKGSASRIVPMNFNDLDDLDDFHDGKRTQQPSIQKKAPPIPR